VTPVNVLMGGLFDALLFPFRRLPPMVGLCVVSLVTAAGIMLVFRAASDQRRLAEVKRRMAATLFEIRLFNDDLPAVFRAQGELLRHNLTYLRLSLAPMLWMIVPIALVVAQLDTRFGYAGVRPGETVLVKVALREGAPAPPSEAMRLDAPSQVRVLTAPVFFPASNEIVWRVRPDAAGEYELTARVGGESVTKTFDATDAVVRRSPARVAPGLVRQLMNPAERPIPESAGVTAITVPYARRAIRVFGWDLDWLVVFFVVSTVFALLLKRPLRVTI
jgi:hypothetical protein